MFANPGPSTHAALARRQSRHVEALVRGARKARGRKRAILLLEALKYAARVAEHAKFESEDALMRAVRVEADVMDAALRALSAMGPHANPSTFLMEKRPRPLDTKDQEGMRLVVERARKGDRRALGRLYETFSGWMMRVALKCVKPQKKKVTYSDLQEAADVAQEAWLSAIENLDRFRGEAAFTTWLYRMVMNECAGRKTATGRKASYREDILAAEQMRTRELPVDVLEPYTVTTTAEGIAQALAASFAKLSPSERNLILAADAEGLLEREIAERHGLKTTVTRTRLLSARKKLQLMVHREIMALRDLTPETVAKMTKEQAKRAADELNRQIEVAERDRKALARGAGS
jgi:RNA polymerase sigma-70 factor (ECF subfamily)